MTKTVEFELKDHPARLGIGGKPREKIKRRGLTKFVAALDPGTDEALFRDWWRRGHFKLGTHAPADLLPFHVGFRDPKVEELLEERRNLEGQLPAWDEEAASFESEALAAQEALEGNTDIRQVETLFAARETAERNEQLAKQKAAAGRRRIDEIDRAVQARLDEIQAAEYSKLKAEHDRNAEAFNAAVRQAYETFRLSDAELAPKLQALGANRPGKEPYHAGVYYGFPELNAHVGRKLKSLEAMPQLRIRGSRYDFSMEDVNDE